MDKSSIWVCKSCTDGGGVPLVDVAVLALHDENTKSEQTTIAIISFFILLLSLVSAAVCPNRVTYI